MPARIFRRRVGLGLAAGLVLAGKVAAAVPFTSRARAAAATRHLE